MTHFHFEHIAAARQETPEETVRRCGDVLDHDARDTIRKIYAPMNRQASDGVAFVVLALVISTAAILLRLIVEN